MRNEQARQRKAARKGELDEALEGTFPASDPVSPAHTSVPSGRADRKEADRLGGDRPEVSKSADRERGDARRVKADLRSRWQDIEAAVRRRPLTAVGIVAAFSYLLAAKR
ncbi:hypothetical protein QTL95_18515 [Rhizobium sp. S152]|nr:hypothetical protein [Rhizobium sp. S152]MDM9627889.1 hypothetical protein [Rhizobium sp. S152]